MEEAKQRPRGLRVPGGRPGSLEAPLHLVSKSKMPEKLKIINIAIELLQIHKLVWIPQKLSGSHSGASSSREMI